MRKILVILLLLLTLAATAVAEETLSIQAPGDVIRPGKAMTIVFTTPEAGTAEILLKDAQGQTLSVVVEAYAAVPGYNALWWNGTYQGVPAPKGEHQLVLILNGATAAVPVTVGEVAPYITHIDLDAEAATPAQDLTVSFYASTPGTLVAGILQQDVKTELTRVPVVEGEQTWVWETALYTAIGLDDGDAFLTLQLLGEDQFPSNEEHLQLTLMGFAAQEEAPQDEEPQDEAPQDEEPAFDGEDAGQEPQPEEEAKDVVFTPAYGSPYNNDQTLNYWTLPMDITDEAAVWEVLMQPITVINDGGKKHDQHKRQIVIREEPDEESAGVGVVTNLTQSVHVLEKGDEWTLIETYSSSFHDSAVKRWNMLVQGYVPTKYLDTVTPNQSMGLVVDKLTQRLYIFKDGALYDTLLCSTGLTNAKQPYNETRSGEFLLQNPAVGGWQDGNMYCDMGIRFNGGDLMHQVPARVNADGSKNFSSYTADLGTKASHGCIRIQRQKTPKGTNMSWIWNNRKDEIKIMIWEDWQGRQIPYPSSETVLYYNPKGGSLYHSADKCYSASKITFQPFTYGELEEGSFAKLKRCTYCTPPLRMAEIDEINALYAPGGDHDPILTEARIKQLEKEAKD